MRILLIEDDPLLGDGVYQGLIEEKHTVDWLKDGKEGKLALQTESFDVVILDIGLPRMTGLELLRATRKAGNNVPVLILTARDSLDDRVKGLDCGADDYLTKPFDLVELIARIRALHRRSSHRATTIIEHGDIEVNVAAHLVTMGGEEITLARREFALLQKLLENTGHVLSRDKLMQTLYGWGDEIDSNALEVHIHNLRKKFGNSFIRTIRGVGYMIEKQQ